MIRRQFAQSSSTGREQFLNQIKAYLSDFSRFETAEFEIVGIQESGTNLSIQIRYDLLGVKKDGAREGRIGQWLTQWSSDGPSPWRMHRFEAAEETVTRAHEPIFLDVTSQALGQTESYKNQLAHGANYWRTVLDGAIGVDVYGNNGVAVGDFDNSGFDSLYVCQPAGLPNRLYRNRGDGSFEDVTEKSGSGSPRQHRLRPVRRFREQGTGKTYWSFCGSGPLLFINQGNEKVCSQT